MLFTSFHVLIVNQTERALFKETKKHVARADLAMKVHLNPQCRKMVRHTLKILQQMLQDFESVPDHITTLRSKGLMIAWT